MRIVVKRCGLIVRTSYVLLVAISYGWCFSVSADDASSLRRGLSMINRGDLKRYVSTLASDALEGREAGSRGGHAALAYLRSELKAIRAHSKLPLEQVQEFGREYHNLLVFVPGSDDRLKHETIVIGAHYDHVGYGNASNSQGPIGQIHNGADDNASGTSALLALVKAFASLDTPPQRSLLFAFWDGEEAGLLGSKHWVAHPTIKLPDVRFAFNIDMLGRLREGKIVTGGWRSAPGLRALLASHNVTNELFFAYQPKVIADSDHYSFYSAGIPVIHIDTDKHHDYHRPSDDPDKINLEGLQLLTEFVYRVTLDAASRPEFPKFRSEAPGEAPPKWMTPVALVPPPVRLGVNWNTQQSKLDIVEVSQISPDSAAAKAGLRLGDRIVELGPWKGGTFDQFKTAIQVVRNPVSIVVERKGQPEPIALTATLSGSPIRLGAGWIDDPALPGCVVVTHVVSDSPADRAGISSGDVIMELDGRPLASSEELRGRVLNEPGPYAVRVERNGRIREVTIDPLDHTVADGPVPTSKR